MAKVRVTVFEDQVARVDLSLDDDEDVEVATLFREGNRWQALEAAPTVLSPRAFLAGLLRLGVLGLGVEDVEPLCRRLDHIAGGEESDFAKVFRAAAKAAEEQQGWKKGS